VKPSIDTAAGSRAHGAAFAAARFTYFWRFN
jgi:hypothetical protein